MKAFTIGVIALCFISSTYPNNKKGDRTWLGKGNQKQRLPKQPNIKHRYVKSRKLSQQYR